VVLIDGRQEMGSGAQQRVVVEADFPRVDRLGERGHGEPEVDGSHEPCAGGEPSTARVVADRGPQFPRTALDGCDGLLAGEEVARGNAARDAREAVRRNSASDRGRDSLPMADAAD
jgi:hypothetical protein